jgi:hypothetical protein
MSHKPILHGRDHAAGGADPIPGTTGGEINIKVFQDTSSVSTGDAKFMFAIPSDLNGLNLVDAQMYVTASSTSGNPEVQIRNVTQALDMLSTEITVKAGEFDSFGAGSTATPSVVNLSNAVVAAGDIIAIDVDASGTGAQGMGVILRFDSSPAGTGAVGPPGATGAAGTGVPVGGSTGQVLAKVSGTDFDTAWVPAGGGGGGGSGAYAHLQHTRASGTAGGSTVANTWTTVPITGITADAGSLIGSLASNQFTLGAGTYRIAAQQAIGNSTQCKLRLRNITDSNTAVVGMTLYAGTAGAIPPIALNGELTIGGTKTFALQYYALAALASIGLGYPVTSGEIEIYLDLLVFQQ